jgi:hypothetical protein
MLVLRFTRFDPKLPYGGPAEQSLETLNEVPCDKRRDYVAEDAMRFHAAFA